MKILIATDGSDFSHKAAEKLCDFVRYPAQTVIRVLSVYQAQIPMAAEPFAISGEYFTALDKIAESNAKAAAEETVDLLKEMLPETSVNISTEVDLGRPAELILDAARNWGADLIVVGSHGRGFWGRLTLGSVSDSVVHHAPCSVLVARAR